MNHLGKKLWRAIAVLLAAMLLLSMSACTARDVDAIINVIEIAGDMVGSDSEPAQSEGESSSRSEARSNVQDDAAEPAPSVPQSTATPARQTEPPAAAAQLKEDGSYTTKEDVALYIHTYGHLPSNFITKKEAEALGWPGGNLEPYAPGKCIGGSRYGNYEGLLPDKKGRSYTECDIDTLGATKRGAKRIVFSNDGLIYYTDDHYETFELLYGEP